MAWTPAEKKRIETIEQKLKEAGYPVAEEPTPATPDTPEPEDKS